MQKFLQNIFILFILIKHYSPSIIVIPFKTYSTNEPDKFKSPSDIFTYLNKNILYSTILIGSPPQNISVLLNSQSYGSSIFSHMCDIPFSSYEKEKSSSFQLKKYINSYSTMKNASLISEEIYLYSDLNLKELKPYKDFYLIFSQNNKEDQGSQYEYHSNTCMNIGFTMGWMNLNERQSNLVLQLKKFLNITETYDFTFEYLTPEEGRIIIGLEPHFYQKEKYSESQYRISYAIEESKINQHDFFLNLDNVFVPYENKITGKKFNESVSMVKSIKIVFDLGMIKAPTEYQRMIDRFFFNDMIKEGKCTRGETDDYYFYYCDKNKAENDIKNNFPNIYFDMKQFHKVFELTYKDLFKIKNDKIFFLMYFRTYNFGNYFEMGKIFLQKYSFTFNPETKMIGYYNFDLPIGKNNNNNIENKEKNFLQNIFIWIGIVVVIIIFGIFGFYFGKIVYDKVRKKRINEVDDDNYDYLPEKNNENNKICDNNDE